MEAFMWLAAVVVGLVAGAGAGYWARSALLEGRLRSARQALEEDQRRTKALLEEIKTQERQTILAAKDEGLRIRGAAEAEARDRRNELQRSERRLVQRDEAMERRSEALERRERQMADREKEIGERRAEMDEAQREKLRELERVAAMTTEEAKAELLKEIETDARQDGARRIFEIEQDLRETIEGKTREMMAACIQRVTSDVVSESTVSVVPLPNEDLKGRIIGREGRNIRAMEAATGVDIIIDDTPDSVTVSAFDPVRREIARLALTRLVADGRIHPARIEEGVIKARQEVENTIRQEGERLVYEAEVHGLHPELIRLLGRMKFRFSYGQNLSKHSLEVAHLSAMIAAEMGLDIKTAKEAGLLHDIGKVVDHDVEGPHALIGGDVLRRYGRPEAVIIGVSAHHYETEPNMYSVITAVADAISGGRPGARRESTDQYIKRLEALERLACAFPGVERCYAIQAGREIRALVKPDEIDDLAALQLARDLAKRIEDTLEYPGQIKVTVLRETRAVEYAR